MTRVTLDVGSQLNWTKYVYERQLFGTRNPRLTRKKRPLSDQINQNAMPVKRHDVLRPYKLTEAVAPQDLEHVFLGFSICGNYVYSYLEVSSGRDDTWELHSLLYSDRVYEFYLWRFIPGKKLEQAFRFKLFDEEAFVDSLSISVEQRSDTPDICVVVGYMATGAECGTLTRTLWHTILFLPHPSTPPILHSMHFYTLYALFSDFRLHKRFLAVATCDELILLDLKQIYSNWWQCARHPNQMDNAGHNPLQSVVSKSVGDISIAKLAEAHHFTYSFQTLQWCSKECEQNLRSTCVGLSDYHLFVETLCDETCDGCVFALFDVDTNERHYFESIFTFRWNLRTNEVELLACTSRDVTDRSKEPGKQQKAFDEIRKELVVKSTLMLGRCYQLSNLSVLDGYSLRMITDATGCIALTL